MTDEEWLSQAIKTLREIASVAYPNGDTSDHADACNDAKDFILQFDAEHMHGAD